MKINDRLENFVTILICLNVLAVILGTVDILKNQYSQIFETFEIFSVVVFTIEFILRIYFSERRTEYILSPLAIIDLVAILPFYLSMFVSIDLRFIRILRLMRILKIGRYSNSIKLFKNVLRSRKDELMVILVFLIFLLIISSGLMYYVENDAQPEHFSSIPESMWWATMTLTTVGYGDVYPITPLGRFIGAIISILGIGLFALPAGILGSGFIEELQKLKKERKVCPHCGKELN